MRTRLRPHGGHSPQAGLRPGRAVHRSSAASAQSAHRLALGAEDSGLPLHDGCYLAGCGSGERLAWPAHGQPAVWAPVHQFGPGAVVRELRGGDRCQAADPRSCVRGFGATCEKGCMTARALLAGWLARQLSADAAAWLKNSAAQIQASSKDADLYLSVSLVTRKVG